jgi:hypothetical protein
MGGMLLRSLKTDNCVFGVAVCETLEDAEFSAFRLED